MRIVDYFKKHVKIIFTDGEILTGRVVDYTIAGDNDPEEESIDVAVDAGRFDGRNIEVYQHEIKTITTLD